MRKLMLATFATLLFVPAPAVASEVVTDQGTVGGMEVGQKIVRDGREVIYRVHVSDPSTIYHICRGIAAQVRRHGQWKDIRHGRIGYCLNVVGSPDNMSLPTAVLTLPPHVPDHHFRLVGAFKIDGVGGRIQM